MQINKSKLVLLAALYFITGAVFLRGGQNIIGQNYQACMEDGLINVKTMEDIYNLQRACMPNAVVMKIFFW